MTTTQRPLETGWLDDTPVGDTLLRRFLHNQADLTALLASAGGGETVRRPDGVVAAFDTSVPYQNQLVPMRPLVGPDDELLDVAEQVLAGYGGTLLSAWPTPDLTSRGWQLMGHPTFVVRGPQPQPLQPGPGVRVTAVETASQLALAERLAIEGYPLPEAAGAAVGSAYPPGTLGTPLRQWVAELDGTPVGVGAAHAAHGVWNLCLAATLPEARRRGVWEALARTRLAEHPELPAAAFTSDFSRAGFEKLGFLAVARLTMWVR